MLIYPQAYGTVTELVHHGMDEELFNVTEVFRSSHVIVSNIKTSVDTTFLKNLENNFGSGMEKNSAPNF